MARQKSLVKRSVQILLPADLLAVLAGEAALVELVPTRVDVGPLIEALDAEDDAEADAEAYVDEAELGPIPHCSTNWSKPVASNGSNGCTQLAQVVIAVEPTELKREQAHVVELHAKDWIYAVRVVEH